jgi:hypothetical protein
MGLGHETRGLSLPIGRSFLAVRAGNELKRENLFHNAKYSLYLAQGKRNRNIIA